MNRISIVLMGLTLLLAACSKNEKKTPSGLAFTVVKAGDGVLPKKEDILVFEYVLKDSKDSVWNSTYTDGLPAAVMIADSSALASENGMIQMFRMISKGDSVLLKMPVKQFFNEIVHQPMPPNVDSTLSITYHIAATDIMKLEAFRAYQATLIEKKTAKQKSKDAEIIAKYLADNKIEAQQDTTGLNYVLHSNTGGKKPSVENCVSVKYKGRLLSDGKVFDQADNIAFPLAQVIRGWQVAVPKLGVGDSATFYIPSGLAYGPQGSPGAIPPDAILIFDVQLLSVGAGMDMATRTCK